MEWWKEYFSNYYALTAFSMNNSAKKEVDFILNKLNLGSGSRVLDMCCGYGRHAVEIAKKGNYEVVGVDYSEHLINLAKERSKMMKLNNLTYIKGDIRTFKPQKQFQLVLNLFISIGFFDEENNILAFKNLCESVQKNGSLVLELHNYKNVKFKTYEKQRVPGGYIFETKRFLDERNSTLIVERLVTKGSESKQYRMQIRIYTLEEILNICEKYDMFYNMHFGSYDGDEFNENSERLILFLKK